MKSTFLLFFFKKKKKKILSNLGGFIHIFQKKKKKILSNLGGFIHIFPTIVCGDALPIELVLLGNKVNINSTNFAGI